MSKCSVQNKVKQVKKLVDSYVTNIRKPLVGKGYVSKEAMEAIIEYLGELDKGNAMVEQALGSKTPKMVSDVNKGKVYKLVSNNFIGTADKALKVGNTPFTALEFVYDTDPELESKVTDSAFMLEGDLKDKVAKVESIVGSLIAKNLDKGTAKVEGGKLVFSGNRTILDKIKESNPAVGLIIPEKPISTTKDGVFTYELNMNALVAVASGTYQTMVDALPSLVGYKDDDMVADIAGIGPAEVTSYVRYRLGMGGMGASLFADIAGEKILRNLGSKFERTLKNVDAKKVQSSFGLLALEMLQEEDLVEPMTVDVEAVVDQVLSSMKLKANKQDVVAYLRSKDSTRYMVPGSTVYAGIKEVLGTTSDEVAAQFRTSFYNTVSVTAKGVMFEDLYKSDDTERDYRAVHTFVIMKPNKLDTVKDGLTLFEDFLDGEETVRGPSFTKPKENENRRKRRDSLSEITKAQEEYLNTAESIGYKYNSGMTALMGLLEGKSREEQVEMLRKALGYPEVHDDMSMETKDANKSRRDRIDKVIEDNLNFYEEAKDKGAFYFKFFLPSNNRAMIDSVTINPQNDKELARWLVSQEGKSGTFAKSAMDELLARVSMTSEDLAKLDKHLVATMIGTVQAFDGATVKGKKLADVEKDTAQDVFDSFAAIMRLDRNTLVDLVLGDSGHVGQKATALAMWDSYNSDSDTVTTDVTYEVDGLTNALFYKVMQTPLEGFEDLAKRVGIVKDAGSAQHMGDITSADKDFLDSYQTLGKKFIENIKGIENLDPGLKTLMDNNLFIVNDLVNAVIDKAVRDFAKPGTMIVNYGAGIGKITEQAITEYIHGTLLDKLVAIKDSRYVVSDKVFSKIAGIPEKEVFASRELIRNAPVTELMKSVMYRNIKESVASGIGVFNEESFSYEGPLPDALNSVYGDYIKLGQAYNTFYNSLFEMFKEKLKDKVPDRNLLNVSKEELDSLMNELRMYIPSLARPDTPVVGSYTTILGRKPVPVQAAMDDGKFYNASSITGSKAAKGNTTVNYLEHLVAGLLYSEPNSPRAKALPFNTHTHDNSDAMSTVMKTYKDTDSFILQIFDALLVDGNAENASMTHNEVATLSNLRFNSHEDIMMRMDMLRDELEGFFVGNDKETRKLNDAYNMVSSMYNQATANRKKLFSRKNAVMQMSGLVKSRYDYNPTKQLREEKTRLDKALTDLGKVDLSGVNEDVRGVVAEILKHGSVTDGTLTKLVFDASWKGLESSELADVLQVVREADTAIRTINGVKLGVSTAETELSLEDNQEYNEPTERKVSPKELSDLLAELNCKG